MGRDRRKLDRVTSDFSGRSSSGLLYRVSTIQISLSVVEFFFLLVVVSLVAREAKAALDRDSLELVWYDNFSGASLDWDKWVVDEGDGCDIDLCDWGNGEKQYYRSENAAVADGNLVITGKREDFASRFYTSSKIITKNKYAFRYGKAEARLKLSEGGQGLWPAFWMMPQDNVYGEWAASGEIDIFESRNDFTEVVNNLNFGAAYPNNTNCNGDCYMDVPDGTLQDFHIYSVEWDEDEFVWFMDDEEICRKSDWFTTNSKTGESLTKPAPFDQDFYLVLNMALGGNDEFVGEGAINDSVLPATMTVDWVRVYQTPENYGEGPESVYLGDAIGGGSRQGVLLWGDDFNGTELSADWEIVEGDDCLGVETLCVFEVQTFHARGTGLEGGTLLLKASAEEVTTTELVAEATGGMVHTKESFNFTYGRLEVNLSAPGVPGVVSAVSLFGDRDDDDITRQIEVVSLEDGMAKGRLWLQDTTMDTTLNFTCEVPPPIGTSISSSSNSVGDGGGYYESSSFYEFAVEWTEDRFRWYVDGRQYCEVTSTELEQEGGSWSFDELEVQKNILVCVVAVNLKENFGAMFVGVGITVGRDLDGNVVPTNSSDLPVNLYVGNLGAYRFVGMEGTPIPSSATKYLREGNLTWQDEFDGIEIDGASDGVMGLEYWWQHEEGDGCEMGICGFGNGEAQWYREENAVVMDGKLVVTAKAEAYAGNIYTSAKLSTNTTVVVSYGRIETRVKLPSAQGLWPSIWMLPQNSPYGGWASSGAIDILQARNHMARVHGQLVFGGAYPDVDNLNLYEGGHCFSDLYEDFSQDYHVFALEWEEDAFRWYVDGVLYCERSYWYSRPGPGEDDYPFPAPFDTGFYLILNVAVGGSFTGGLIDEDALAENPEMLVDYVRVYTLEGQSVFVADPPEESSDGRSGSALSAVTAVSVLVVLGILFTLCLVGNCISRRLGKRAEQQQAAAAAAATATGGAAPSDDSKVGVTNPNYRAHWRQNPVALAGREGVHAASSRARTSRLRQGQESETAYMSSDERKSGGGGFRLDGGIKMTPRNRTPDQEAFKSPMWGRAVGADENRLDVTPARMKNRVGDAQRDPHHYGQEGDGDEFSDARNTGLRPSMILAPGSRQGVPYGGGGKDGFAPREKSMFWATAQASAEDAAPPRVVGSEAGYSSSSASVELSVDQAILSRQQATAAIGLMRHGSATSSWKGGHHRGDRGGGDWSSTGSAGSLVGSIARRNSYVKSESVCSDESGSDRDFEHPTPMPGLTNLDFASRDQGEEDGYFMGMDVPVRRPSPPSYARVTGSAAGRWR